MRSPYWSYARYVDVSFVRRRRELGHADALCDLEVAEQAPARLERVLLDSISLGIRARGAEVVEDWVVDERQELLEGATVELRDLATGAREDQDLAIRGAELELGVRGLEPAHDHSVRAHAVVGRLVDREHEGRRSGVPDDRQFLVGVQPGGQRIVTEVRQLVLADSRCSTEQHVRGYSVVASVGHRGGEVRELALRGGERPLGVERVAGCAQDRERPRVIGDRAHDIGKAGETIWPAEPIHDLTDPGVEIGIARIHEW